MSRPRKPTSLKLLSGTARPDRINKNEPKIKAFSPSVPMHLKGTARWCWRRLVRIIGPMKVMTAVDVVALELTARAWADVIKMGEILDEKGQTYVSKAEKGTNADGNPVLNISMRQRPEVDIMSDAWRRLEKMLTHFGISPSSRSRVSVINELKEANPWDQF